MSVEINPPDENAVRVHQHWHIKDWQIWSIDKEIIFHSSTFVGFRTNQKPLVAASNDQSEYEFRNRALSETSNPILDQY